MFGAFKEAMETLNKLPDREAGWIYCTKSLWPAHAHDREDAKEAYRALLERIQKGEESPDVLLPRKLPTAKAVARMDACWELWRFMKTRDRRKAWISLCRLAEGRLPAAQIAKIAGCSRRTVYELKDAECAAIAKQLVHLMPTQDEVNEALRNAGYAVVEA